MAIRRKELERQQRREHLLARYGQRLFADMLVPVDGGDTGWRALEQALAWRVTAAVLV